MTKEELELIQQAREAIKAIYDDKVATINGRDYNFMVMTFSERKSVFAYMSSIQEQAAKQDFSFIDTPEFKKIEAIIFRSIQYDGSNLSKLDNHFDNYIEDYIPLITTALQVISYPFSKGSNG